MFSIKTGIYIPHKLVYMWMKSDYGACAARDGSSFIIQKINSLHLIRRKIVFVTCSDIN